MQLMLLNSNVTLHLPHWLWLWPAAQPSRDLPSTSPHRRPNVPMLPLPVVLRTARPTMRCASRQEVNCGVPLEAPYVRVLSPYLSVNDTPTTEPASSLIAVIPDYPSASVSVANGSLLSHDPVSPR